MPRHKIKFVVVSASVWVKNSLNNWCRYRLELVLPFFFCTPPSVGDSLFVFASCLPLFLGKTQKIAPVLRGTGIFSCFFFSLLLSSVTRTSLSLHACLRLTEKRWKIAPVLQIQASSMKLRVHGFLFLVFLHIKTDGKNKLFFYDDINIQIRRFSSELVESKSCGKYCLIIIRIGMHTALLAFSLGM